MSYDWLVHTDGSCLGNPGPAGIGVVLEDMQSHLHCEIFKPIGPATNNIAEYEAIILALQHTQALKPGSSVQILSDSELVVGQINGSYQTSNLVLKRLCGQVRVLIGERHVALWHIPREDNTEADRLARLASEANVDE